jgi:hypothetical protein
VVAVLSGIPPASLSSFARTAVTFRRPPAAVSFLCQGASLSSIDSSKTGTGYSRYSMWVQLVRGQIINLIKQHKIRIFILKII